MQFQNSYSGLCIVSFVPILDLDAIFFGGGNHLDSWLGGGPFEEYLFSII